MKRYVICLNNEGYAASLEVRKLYELIPAPKAEAMHCIRIADKSGNSPLHRVQKGALGNYSVALSIAYKF